LILTEQAQKEFLQRGFSRRSLGKIAAMITAGATMPFYNEPALAQLSRVEAPPDSVFINSNENPLGPCDEARQAVHDIVAQGGRYLFGETDKVAKLLAQQEGLKSTDYVKIYPGSSGPLHQSVLAFTSPTKPLVMADPGYEAGAAAASFIGSKTVRVPLTSDYRHDVKAMLKAGGPTPGMFYICNPNNPTGTLTPKSEIEWLVENKPKGSIVVVDEAYTHLSEAPFNSDLVAKEKDVVVLRTFSKIYGMAGLRAGAAFGRPDLLKKVDGWSHTMMPITGMVAASASLQVKNLIPERRAKIAAVRNDTFEFLEKNKFKFIPSVSNCFMIDVKKPGGQVGAAMVKEKVVIGRVWPVWPTYVRVTVGTDEEMKKFQAAFLKVMSA
jgi:histidinol-phosphate/aromatic aminotransferase/cobyric acid decarboxylase-like protein